MPWRAEPGSVVRFRTLMAEPAIASEIPNNVEIFEMAAVGTVGEALVRVAHSEQLGKQISDAESGRGPRPTAVARTGKPASQPRWRGPEPRVVRQGDGARQAPPA